jgi:uncharacterized protein YcaQ
VGRTFARLQLVQIDSVNVLARSHFLPFFSRLGHYDRAILERLSGTHPRRMVEYWAHEASYIRPEHFSDLRLWQKRAWVGAHTMDRELRDTMSARILETLATARPMTAAQIADRIGHVEEKQNDNWGWNWSAVKRVLEHLFEEGLVTAASRTGQFERRYTLTSRVLPQLPAAPPTQQDLAPAMHRLIDAAAQAHGIGTVRCFADYFRTPAKAAAASVEYLVACGRLEPVTVRGWNRDVFLHKEARLPRQAVGRALLSPFDSLVFVRRRLEELFGFHYRIEIYTPEPKRRYGYYVLPFLLRDRLVARVDLKADRAGGRLLAKSAYAEPGAPPDTAVELAAELRLMADWLGLPDVEVGTRGDLAGELARAVSAGWGCAPLSGKTSSAAVSLP